MSGPAGQALLSFVIALLAALFLMPLAIALGRSTKSLVRPRLFGMERRHRITYLGGFAVVLSTLLGFTVANGDFNQWGPLLLGAVAIFLVGFADDRAAPKGWHPLIRFILQSAVATATWWYALRDMWATPAGAVFAVIVLVGCANAFNLLDNMDGVAGWTAVGTAAGIAGVALLTNSAVASVSAAIAGAALGFLPFNFRKARVYLGDGGALFLGLILSASALRVAAHFGPGWKLVAIVTLLAVPATDGWVAVISRFLHARPLYIGGLDHVSHRLVHLGVPSPIAAGLHGLLAMCAAGSVAFATTTRPEVMVLAIALLAAGGLGLLLVRVHESDRSRWGRRLVTAVGLVLGGSVLMAVPPFLAAAPKMLELRDAMTQAVQTGGQFDLEASGKAFSRARTLAAEASSELNGPATFPIRLLPLLGDNVDAVGGIAAGAESVSSAATAAIVATEQFPQGAGGPEIGFNGGRISLESWKAARPHLAKAAGEARSAVERVEGSGGFLVPPVSNVRTQFLERARGASTLLGQAQASAELLPELFGGEGPRSWFLAIQNPVEQRATGGFLGAFGILKAEGGQLSLERLDSNLALPELEEPVSAPQEFIDRYDRFGSRVLYSNVNMTPDFPTAAQVVTSMWERTSGEKVDGVLAMDAVALANLLRVVGPVNSEEFGEINADNFLPFALNEAYVRFPQKQARADFLLTVGRDVWSRLLTGDFRNPRSAGKALADSVKGNNLQWWIPGKERLLTQLGLSGTLSRPTGSDFLMVVGQNGAGNKVDFYSHRRVTYRVSLRADGSYSGRVSTRIENRTPKGLPSTIAGPYLKEDGYGLNRSYLSFYLPGGTGVLRGGLSTGEKGIESHKENGFAVASRFVEVPPEAAGEFDLTLEGNTTSPGDYRLYVRRQAVLNPDTFRLEITLPPQVFPLEFEGMNLMGRTLFWEGPLMTDKQFRVQFGSGVSARLRSTLNRITFPVG